MATNTDTPRLDRLTRDHDDLRRAFTKAKDEVDEARAKYKRSERLREKLVKERQAEEARMRTRSNPNSDLCQSILGLHLSSSEAEDACEKASQDLRTAARNLDATWLKVSGARSALDSHLLWQRRAEEAEERKKAAEEAAQKAREEDERFQRWVNEQARKLRQRQEAEEKLAKERDRAFAEQERRDRECERQNWERENWARLAREREAREREEKAQDAKAQEEFRRKVQEEMRGEREKQKHWERYRKEKARMEAAQAKSATASKPAAGITKQSIAAFFAAFDAMPSDRSDLKVFPEPPSEPCKQLACKASAKDRKLAACPCNIKKVFRGLTNIKAMRNRFHPDKFARCSEEVREERQKKAQEVFVVLSGMI